MLTILLLCLIKIFFLSTCIWEKKTWLVLDEPEECIMVAGGMESLRQLVQWLDLAATIWFFVSFVYYQYVFSWYCIDMIFCDFANGRTLLVVWTGGMNQSIVTFWKRGIFWGSMFPNLVNWVWNISLWKGKCTPPMGVYTLGVCVPFLSLYADRQVGNWVR